MGKRSSGFKKRDRGYYPTPREAVEPLLDLLREGTAFYEPCAGDGSLAAHLSNAGHICTGMSDIAPQVNYVKRRDALKLKDCGGADVFITNPPWDTRLMHPILEHLLTLGPCWLLLYGDWLFTQQAAPYVWRADVVVPIGRVKWIPGSPHIGKDNACWVHFSNINQGGPVLLPRKKKPRPGLVTTVQPGPV